MDKFIVLKPEQTMISRCYNVHFQR